MGQGQGGFGEEVIEASRRFCIQASKLTEADGPGEVSVTFAQVKSAGCGILDTLFDWAVIILLRSQDLEYQIGWLGKAKGYNRPLFGNVSEGHLSCSVKTVSGKCSFVLVGLLVEHQKQNYSE